jgi:aminopeptidase-like protein
MGRFKLSSSDTRFASELLSELFPICRSITGNGVRESLAILNRKMKLNIQEIPSGTKVFDWTIPKEWNIRDAYIADPNGKRIVDFKKNNLHVMSYSTPVKLNLSFDQLQPHLYTLPNLPEAVPYRTSYFKEDWAFCLTQHQFDQINRDFNYEVFIDADLKDGSLTLADTKLSGSSNKKYLISTYCCHPSMANDNLSGLIVASLLYQKLEKKELRHNYLFVILPETIGAITYLSQHRDEMRDIDGGFVITTCGGPGAYGHKETYLGNHAIDRAIRLAFRDANQNLINYPFVRLVFVFQLQQLLKISITNILIIIHLWMTWVLSKAKLWLKLRICIWRQLIFWKKIKWLFLSIQIVKHNLVDVDFIQRQAVKSTNRLLIITITKLATRLTSSAG